MKIIIIFLFIASISFAQQYPMSNRCAMIGDPNESVSPTNFMGGKWKPHRTDVGGTNENGPTMYVLLVFVQFDQETIDGSAEGWEAGQAPDYINELITDVYDSRSDWWNAYNGYSFCKYWCDVSRGSLHMIGKAYSVKLAHTEQWYSQQYTGNHAIVYRNAMINKEIYDAIIPLVGDDWPKYDQWTFNGNGDFSHVPDEKLDMMIKVHRTTTITDHNAVIINSEYEGMGFLGPPSEVPTIVDNYELYNSGGVMIRVDKNFGGNGSGMTLNGRGGAPTKDFVIDVAAHEYCHYLMGSAGHMGYAKMGGTGWEFGFSPREMIKLDFIRPKYVDYSRPTHTLGDYSSRYGSSGTAGEILKVPVGIITEDDDEYFLIANRRKFSFTDFRMYGDTLPHERRALKQVNPDYGKGVYIYHNYWGLIYPPNDANYYVDLECADGLWEWENNGEFFYPFGNVVPVGKHITPLYRQDSPLGGTWWWHSYGDQMSGKIPYAGNFYSNWYTPGKTHSSQNMRVGGTDRVFTNDKDFWFSLASFGDRWDAWNIGYNQVFSPYSSPNTYDWDNKPTGIFIYYESLDANQNAIIKVYRKGEGGYTNEDMILQVTPPSKPMGITSTYFLESENIARPMISWVQNQEPDMVRSNGKERYKIYRATESSMNFVPTAYTLIDEKEFDFNETPYYVDYSILGEPSYWPGLGEVVRYPVRYYVVAVDDYGSTSVPSDFADAIGLIPDEGGEEEAPDNSNGLNVDDLKDRLLQNFPNPFNPSTTINFEIPSKGLVILKVYDILGREVQTLVNEIKDAGRYSARFDGSNFSSGIYFYKIQTVSGSVTKKMFLVK